MPPSETPDKYDEVLASIGLALRAARDAGLEDVADALIVIGANLAAEKRGAGDGLGRLVS